MQKLALGIDLGGTNLRVGMVSNTGDIIDFHVRPIDRNLSGDEILDQIIDLGKKVHQFTEAIGIGIALSASIPKNGVLLEGSTTLPGLVGYPLAGSVSKHLEKPCQLDNDASLALLGEAHFGAAKGVNNVLLLSLGTGLGGGMILGGKLWRGAHSSACEIGLTLVEDPEGCGYVPVETLAAPGALMQRLGDPRGQLFEKVISGDEQAVKLVDTMFERLGILVANTHLLLDLELVLLGGGLASSGELLKERVQAAFDCVCHPSLKFGLRIERVSLPPDAAGVVGAACLSFESQGFLPALGVSK